MLRLKTSAAKPARPQEKPVTDSKSAIARPHATEFDRAPDPESPASWGKPSEQGHTPAFHFDRAMGAPTPSFVFGTPGNDTLQGGRGGDLILGFAGNDLIHGNGGNDVIVGGPGNDRLHGGAGDDIFVFRPGDDGFDTIADFEPGDRILLLGATEDQISLIPTPSGLYDPPSGIDLIYSVPTEYGSAGRPVLYFPGLTNADFQTIEDAIIFG